MKSSDRNDVSRVTKSMTRRFGMVLLCFAIACGGGDKKAATTPTGGSGSGSASQSMNDGNDPELPVGTGTGGGNDPGSVGNNPGGTGSNGPAPYQPPPEAVVQMPSFDMDPAQAKSQVDQHLATARNALSLPTPDAETALKEAKAALALDASSTDAAAMLAFAYYHKKLYDTSELVLDDVLNRDKVAKRAPSTDSNANLNYVYGLIYDKTNRPQQAQLAFQKAVELNGNFASALVNLGKYQLMNQQYQGAQATFEKLTSSLNRNDAVTLTSLGSAYRGRASEFPPSAGEHDQFVRNADSAYKRALQANGNYGPAYYNLGLLYLDNDPFPGIPDALQRLNLARDFFEKYKAAPGFDLKMHADRIKDVDKAIKKASKKKPKAAANP